MPLEYVIYTDESEKEGKYFSNFYGGLLVRSDEFAEVIESLQSCKLAHNLLSEVKWQKVTENYLDKYKALIDCLFEHVHSGRVKIRVMFTQNQFVPTGLTPEQRKNAYYLLYYQFVKHAFGLQFAPAISGGARLRINLDQLPENREDNLRFKSFIVGLNRNPEFRKAGFRIQADQIAEVRSHDHVLLQCLDVVLGSMAFRLNDKHKEKPEGARRRGKRTVAKERLFKHILAKIKAMHAGFNVGITTGKKAGWESLWCDSYRHWKFIPKDHERDSSKTKRKK